MNKMTKRWGAFDDQGNSKKQKTNDIDDLWGEGLDDKDLERLEECLEFATQVVNERQLGNMPPTQSNNITILPNYSAFNIPNNNGLISSTPVDSNLKPTTSKVCFNDGQTELEKLRQQQAEKDGEIAILRSKLQELKVKVEQQKTLSDWREKLQVTVKEMKTVKSELEFKNLEIANLKQKLLDVRSQSNLDSSFVTPQVQKKSTAKPKVDVIIERSNNIHTHQDAHRSLICKKEVIPKTIYPLKSVISPNLFKMVPDERHIINNRHSKVSRNTLPYLCNQISDSDSSCKHKCFTIENKIINVDYVYPEIFEIVNSSEEEIDSCKRIPLLNKIICVSVELLLDFWDYLKEFENHLTTEDLTHADSEFLKSSFTNSCDFTVDNFGKDEIGIRSGQILTFLGEILPYSQYLCQYVSYNKLLKLDDCDNNFPHFGQMKNGSINFLDVILDICKLIGTFRMFSKTTYFLSSVVKLLTSIYKSKSYETVSEQVHKILKEVIFSRPSVEVFYHMTWLFKVASHHAAFVEYLFGSSQNPSIKTNASKGISHFNYDVCPFAVFADLFKNTLLRMKQLPVVVCINMLTFIENTFLSSFWSHHSSSKQCSQCLLRLYSLVIETAFRGLERYVENVESRVNTTDDWDTVLKHKIVSKVIRVMATNKYEIGDFAVMYSQVKEIERKIAGLSSVNHPEELGINDEGLVTISSENFVGIDF